jgi:septal ring factor EnvC (AmiA/AmiB activator)
MTESCCPAASGSTSTAVIAFPTPAPTGALTAAGPKLILSDDGASYPRTGDSPLWTITLGMFSAGLLVLVGIFWFKASSRSSIIQQNKNRTEQIEASYAARQLQLNEAKAVNIRLQWQLDETKAVISQLYSSLGKSRAETDDLQVELVQFRARSVGFPLQSREPTYSFPKRLDEVELASDGTPAGLIQFNAAKAGLAQTLAYLSDAQTQAAELMMKLENATADVAQLPRNRAAGNTP